MAGDGKSPTEMRQEREQDTVNVGGPNMPAVNVPRSSFGPAAGGQFSEQILQGLGAEASQGRGVDVFQDYVSSVIGGEWYRPHDDTNELRGETMDMRGLGRRSGSSTMADVIDQVSQMGEAELSYLQRRLFQGGFYSSNIYGNAAGIHWGNIDQHTIRALQKAIDKAGLNEIEDFDRFLDTERARFGRSGTNADGDDISGAFAASQGAGNQPVNIVLEDPDAIRLIAEQAGQELLGRKPTEKELAVINEKLWAEQRAAQRVPATQMTPEEAELAANQDTTGSILQSGESRFAGTYQPADPGRLDAEQLGVVNTIVDVGERMGLSEEYIVAAISAGIVESGLRNINFGDRDSLGVFQQRPSQGWGTPQQIRDVPYAARKFFEAMLAANPGDNLGEWVANTQRPAEQYRGRYAEVMDRAAGIFRFATTQDPRDHLDPDNLPASQRGGDMMGKRGRPTRDSGDDSGGGFSGLIDDLIQPAISARDRVLHDVPERADDGGAPFWFDTMAQGAGNSMQDPVYREQFNVNPRATINMAVREADPKAYETKQAAMKAYEFFSLMNASGGGAV